MIYFQGCTARSKLKNIAKNTRKILDTAGVDYKILEDEECCGSILLRTGFQEDAHEMMVKTFNKLKGEKIVVSCAGCYRTLREDYPQIFGDELDVIHISQLLQELIKEGKIKVDKIKIDAKDLKVTYHDPCHLGRHCGEFEAPRQIIAKKAQLREMDKNRENARCCGSGGGVKSAYPKLSSAIAHKRIDDALEIGADLLVTCCPFCVLNLESEKLKVMDLTEFVLLSNETLSEEEIPSKNINLSKNIPSKQDGLSQKEVSHEEI